MKDRLSQEIRQRQEHVSRSGLPDNDINAVQNILDGSLGKYHRPLNLQSVKMFSFVICVLLLPNAVNSNELRKVLVFGAVRQSVGFSFVYEIYWAPLNGFAPRCIWSLDRTSLKVMVKGQRSTSLWTKNDIFRPFWRPVCSLFMLKHL